MAIASQKVFTPRTIQVFNKISDFVVFVILIDHCVPTLLNGASPCYITIALQLSVCRRLAEISRLTRGVVVLICDVNYAKRVMDEARRLNMLEGNFFWLWLDASKDVDIFQNMSNRTLFSEDNDQDYENLRDNDEAPVYERFDRSKRYYADNKTNEAQKRSDTSTISDKNVENSISEEFNSMNKLNSRKHRVRRNLNVSNSYGENNKLLDKKFSQSYVSNRNISSESVKINNVNNKGVETSKIENNSIAKGMSFHNRNNSRRNSNRKWRNESFNKYVNSIHVDDANVVNNFMGRDDAINNDNTRDIKSSIDLSSDISDFLMDPKVHAFSMHNFKENPVKRIDRYLKKEDLLDKGKHKAKDNMTVIFKSLPVGLLALHPQPVKIGEFMNVFYFLN